MPKMNALLLSETPDGGLPFSLKMPANFSQSHLNKTFSGYPERTSGIECGSGFQPRQLISRLEAAPTEGLSNET